MSQAEILSQLVDTTVQLPGWRVLRQAVEQQRTVHLAVMVEPYLTYILEGKKSIESRFSKHAIAPFRQIGADDLVLLKLTGGPVVGCFTTSTVEFVNLNTRELERLRTDYSDAICADQDFWEARADKRYATLVGVSDARELRSAPVAKSDRRGWLVMQTTQPVDTGDQLMLV
jgi:hypothetical protein